jgi:hypothetical protein
LGFDVLSLQLVRAAITLFLHSAVCGKINSFD